MSADVRPAALVDESQMPPTLKAQIYSRRLFHFNEIIICRA